LPYSFAGEFPIRRRGRARRQKTATPSIVRFRPRTGNSTFDSSRRRHPEPTFIGAGAMAELAALLGEQDPLPVPVADFGGPVLRTATGERRSSPPNSPPFAHRA